MEGILPTADHLNSRQFFIAVKKLADTLGYGTDRSPFLGSGLEYIQSRPYMPGDSIRSIDWKVTARSGNYFVKEYEAPKRMPCLILLDTSASMTISSQARSKYAMGVHIAGGIAFACLDRVSPVGIVGVGGRDFRTLPTLSRSQIMEWLHHLRHFRYDEPTTLSRRVTEIAPTLASRHLIITISDLHEPEAIPALKLLAQRHDCVVLQMQDPAERGLAGAGFLRAREAETGKSFVTRGKSLWLDPEEMKDDLRRARVDHFLLQTERPFAALLRQFFKSRGLLGRGAR